MPSEYEKREYAWAEANYKSINRVAFVRVFRPGPEDEPSIEDYELMEKQGLLFINEITDNDDVLWSGRNARVHRVGQLLGL